MAEPLDQGTDDFLKVFDQTKTAVLENRRVWIAIDRTNYLRIGDAHNVLASARDGDGHVQLRGDFFAGLTNLP